MKGYRKPTGHYIAEEDHVPVGDHLVEVALRPSLDHAFTANWESDTLNESICWRLKTQAELDAEVNVEFDSSFTQKDKRFLRDALYLMDKRVRVLEGKPAITKSQFTVALKSFYRDA